MRHVVACYGVFTGQVWGRVPVICHMSYVAGMGGQCILKSLKISCFKAKWIIRIERD